MRNFILVCTTVMLIGLAYAQADPGWVWAKRGGGSGDEQVNDLFTGGTMITGLSKYVIGSFSGTSVFGTTTLTSSGGTDIFIAKMGPAGTWLWAKRAGGINADEGLGIASDGLGYLRITGYFSGTATFGSTNLVSYGNSPDIFVAKLDNDGNWQWAAKAGWNWEDYGTSVSCDNVGNSYVTGSFFGSTAGAYFGAIYLPHSDYADDIFVAKIDPYGTWLWARSAGAGWGTWNYDRGNDIHTDYSSGTSWVTGSFEGTANFGTNPVTSSGGKDIFVAKIDNAGNWLWSSHAGGSAYDGGKSITVDLNGNSYVTGNFVGTATFAYNQILNSAGSDDIFVAKLDNNGAWQWATRAGGSGQDIGYGIALGSNVYLTGTFQNTASFGAYSVTSNGGWDACYSRLDLNGNWLAAKRAGGPGNDYGRAISYKSNPPLGGWITVAGDFEGLVDFGSALLSSQGESDVFLTDPTDPGVIVRPLPPQNLVTYRNGSLYHMQWNPVTQDTNGNPVTPSYYQVYWASNPYGPYTATPTTTTNCWWEGSLAPLYQFFRVKAVVLD